VGADEWRLRGDDGIVGAMFETFVATELERQASFSPGSLTFLALPRGPVRPSGRGTSRASSTSAIGSGSGSHLSPVPYVLASDPRLPSLTLNSLEMGTRSHGRLRFR
jgi:hypothetical protein